MEQYSLPRVIGHRGACGYAPENTLSSFKKAAELGVKCVEFDVKLTRDGELVVIHDENLLRTTNGIGFVQNYTCSQLQQFDAGSWFNSNFLGEKILTLEELMIHLNQNKISTNIELKPELGQEQTIAEKTLELLYKFCKKPPSSQLYLTPLISSFSYESLAILRDRQIQAADNSVVFLLGKLFDKWGEDSLSKAHQLNCYSIHCADHLVTSALINDIKKEGFKVLVYTVNQLDRAQQLWDWGVDSVFSDYPDRLFGQYKT